MPGTCVKSHVYACLPSTTRGEKCMLSADPKGKTFIYSRTKHFVIRDIENPLECFTYDEHPCKATTAQYAPSGFYICSGDESGKIRIWDTTQEEHKLKYEYPVLGGKVNDIMWTEDSKRIVVGGGGGVPGRALLWDSGSSCGEILGHTKAINGVAVKQTRPFRVVTASEDGDQGIFNGPPFKFDHMNHEAVGSYLNMVRYNSDDSLYVSVSAKGKAFIYDGKDGTFKGELNGGAEQAHTAGIYGISFGADPNKCITCSADKTVKMWDVAENTLLTTFTFADDGIGNQMLGCVWSGDNLISVGLNGAINYLDVDAPGTPKKIITGHTSNVMALAVDDGAYYAGGVDGRVNRSSVATGDSTLFDVGHKNQVVDVLVQGDTLVTASMDDTMTFSDKAGGKLTGSVKLESQPRGISAGPGDLVAAACQNHILLFKGGKSVFSIPTKSYEALCISVKPGGSELAVGGDDNNVHIYTIDGDTLAEKQVINLKTGVISIAYSPDGAVLATGEKSRAILIYDASTYAVQNTMWKYHTAAVNCLSWSPDSLYLASGSLDTSIIIWSMAKKMERVQVKGAHPTANINSLQWGSNTELFSAGNDACVRSWTFTPP